MFYCFNVFVNWSIYTTKLEPILPKIPEKIQSLRPAAVPLRGTASQKNCSLLLKEKPARAKLKKCKGNFSARFRALKRGAAGRLSFFSHF